jgi:hypothetical protein
LLKTRDNTTPSETEENKLSCFHGNRRRAVQHWPMLDAMKPAGISGRLRSEIGGNASISVRESALSSKANFSTQAAAACQLLFMSPNSY